MGNILAAQAGHYGRINEQVYAVEAGQPFGLLPGRIEQFAVASRLWHSLLLRPTLPEGRSGCESESLLPDLSRSSQPTQKPRIRSDPRPHAVRSLPWPFLYLDPEWQLLVCIQCQTALYYTQVRRHVEDHSRNPSLSDPERQTLQSLKIQSLPNIWHRLRAQAPPIPPFPSLPQWEAVTCQWPGCSALCISRKSMQTHIRSQHAPPDPGTVRSLIGGPVSAQSLTRARGFIFRVQRAVDAEEPGHGGSRPRGDEGLAHPDSREVRAHALRYPGCGVFVARL
ncbi:hypothetical protein ATETN484_0013042700 [Aspergillus terreus]|nr:hypothetical protein ATETN484_0013042700 [Aspergillus terreus]